MNSKYCPDTYKYMIPIFVIYDQYKAFIKRNREIIEFMILLDMCNTSYRYNMNGDLNKQLFVNMVLFYRHFNLDLPERFMKIQRLWDNIEIGNRIIKLSNELEIRYEEIPAVNNECSYEFNKLLKFMFQRIDWVGIRILGDFSNSVKINFKLINKYISPIIFWHQNVKKQFQNENQTDLLFQISRYTRNMVSHFSTLVLNTTLVAEDNLKLLMNNICIIYFAFGVNLYAERVKVRDFLQTEPTDCTFVDGDIHFGVATQSVEKEVVINSIENILIDKFIPRNKEYFLFGYYLHHSVSTRITNSAKRTRVFLDFKNKIERSQDMNHFIFKEKIDRKFYKFASPLLVWIKVFDRLEADEFNNNFNGTQEFYQSMNNTRNRIIRYLRTNQYNKVEENSINRTLNRFYKPIKNATYHHNLENIQYYDLFKKLVEHSVFVGNNQFSSSFIFNYKQSGNEIHDKLCDIFNFSGVFFIFLDFFEEFPQVPRDAFYGEINNLSVVIIRYMQHQIRNEPENFDLLNEAIDGIKLIFSDFRRVERFDAFHIIFAQLYFHMVSSKIL